MCMHTHLTLYMKRSQDLPLCAPKDQTQSFRLVSRHLYLLNHITGQASKHVPNTQLCSKYRCVHFLRINPYTWGVWWAKQWEFQCISLNYTYKIFITHMYPFPNVLFRYLFSDLLSRSTCICPKIWWLNFRNWEPKAMSYASSRLRRMYKIAST